VTDDLSALLKPRVPVPNAPRGFVEMERYSSIKRLWDWLEGLHAHGFEVRVPKRGGTLGDCRREVRGLTKTGAGGLLDTNALLELLGKDDTAILEAFSLEPEALRAVNQILEGDKSALVAILNRDYRLVFQIQLCFTVRRELMLRADASFEAFEDRMPLFPVGWNLKPVRWRRDDYRQLLDRAARGSLLP
jgi:hypothetical protein